MPSESTTLRESAPAGPPSRVHRVSAGGRVVTLPNRDLLPYLVSGIGRATRRVLAAVFIVDPRPEEDPEGTVRLLLDTLGRARWRGLDVRVLIGGSARTPAIELACRVAYQYLERAEVPTRRFAAERGETSLHSKYFIIDDTVVVGSHNWTHRALAGDNELSLAVTSADTARTLWFEFERDWRRAEEGSPDARDS